MLFNYIIKEYMLAAKEAAEKRREIATIIIRKCFEPRRQIVNIILPELKGIPAMQNTAAPG
jgi:hypothetical protein